MFTKLKEKLSLFIEVTKAGHEINSNPCYMVFNKTVIAGVEIYIDDKVVLAATGTKTTPNAVFTPTGIIVVNNALLSLSSAHQAAIILHECGHKVLKHKPTPVVYQIQLLLGCGKSLQMEYEADLYAVKHNADMLSLLKHWWNTYPETRLVSLRKRIAKLEAYYAKFEPKFN